MTPKRPIGGLVDRRVRARLWTAWIVPRIQPENAAGEIEFAGDGRGKRCRSAAGVQAANTWKRPDDGGTDLRAKRFGLEIVVWRMVSRCRVCGDGRPIDGIVSGDGGLGI